MVRLTVALTLFVLSCNISVAQSRVIASNYWEDKWVATGHRFNPNLLAAAHKTLPFGTLLTLSFRHRKAVVVINDRGPYIKGRTLDLTPAAKKALACTDLCPVKMDYWPPLPTPAPIRPQVYADADQ